MQLLDDGMTLGFIAFGVIMLVWIIGQIFILRAESKAWDKFNGRK